MEASGRLSGDRDRPGKGLVGGKGSRALVASGIDNLTRTEVLQHSLTFGYSASRRTSFHPTSCRLTFCLCPSLNARSDTMGYRLYPIMSWPAMTSLTPHVCGFSSSLSVGPRKLFDEECEKLKVVLHIQS
jgi:hypothetical protein